MVPAYVINVPATVDETLHRRRRAHIEAELRNAGVDYRFVRAVDGARLTARERGELVDDDFVNRNPWATDGILGAALSHAAAYHAILKDGWQAAIVLEDDALLPDNTAALLDELSAHVRRREVVLLHWLSRTGPAVFSECDRVELAVGGTLRYPMRLAGLGSAAAYLVTAGACRGLVEATSPIRSSTDTWEVFHQAGAFDSLRCVTPRALGTRASFKSTVNYHGGQTLRAALSAFIARSQLFPLYQLLAMVRKGRERRMGRYMVVAQRSPLAG